MAHGPHLLEIMTVPNTSLNTGDAVELAEMLQFADDWLAADPGELRASLGRFVGNPAYGPHDLRRTWAASSFCLAAATVKDCSTPLGSKVIRPWSWPPVRDRGTVAFGPVWDWHFTWT